MDVLGVKQMRSKRHGKINKKDIKVVYISTPMKVNTCASKFRALVQELTGKDSDVALQFMDSSTTNDAQKSTKVLDRGLRAVDDHVFGVPVFEPNNESSTCSEYSGLEKFDLDDVLVPQMEGSFMEMLTSTIFHESSQLDALRSFGSV